nr:hypothetical protein [uncultured Sphingomonas sp.]
MATTLHHQHSVLRERIVEHRFIADVLAGLWQAGRTDVEVLHAEFDRGGYDLVVDLGGVTRQIQLKCSHAQSTTAKVPVSRALSRQRSGCVLWIVVDEGLSPIQYRWFGGKIGEKLPDLSAFPILKRTTFNSKGDRPNRDGHNIPKRAFEVVPDIASLLVKLFGPDWNKSEPQAVSAI